MWLLLYGPSFIEKCLMMNTEKVVNMEMADSHYFQIEPALHLISSKAVTHSYTEMRTPMKTKTGTIKTPTPPLERTYVN